MKKICAILVVLAITLTLFACFPGKTPDNPDNNDPNSSQSGNNNSDSGNNNSNDNNKLPSNPLDGPLDLPILPAA